MFVCPPHFYMILPMTAKKRNAPTNRIQRIMWELLFYWAVNKRVKDLICHRDSVKKLVGNTGFCKYNLLTIVDG